MKKSIFAAVIAIMLCAACFVIWQKQNDKEDQLPPMVMLNDVVYVLYDQAAQIPEGEPQGWIGRIIGNEIPYENGQANFGKENMPYWYNQNGICVKTAEDYFLTGQKYVAEE